jgi:hypothetical protein
VRPCSLLLSLLATALLLVACEHTKVEPITDLDLKKVPADSVKVFLGVPEEELVELAHVDSSPSFEKSVRSKRAQIEEMRKRAGRLGADAIIDVRLLVEEREGLEPDPTTPFTGTVRQGESPKYFLRGRAIKFREAFDDAEWEEIQAGLLEEEEDLQLDLISLDPPRRDRAIDRIPEVRTFPQPRPNPARRLPPY